MRLRDPVECLYLSLMHRWQVTAPPDHNWGLLDGEPVQNSQVARLAYVLKKVAVGQVEQVFRALEKLTRRRDGSSLISTQPARMESPYPLWDGWYLEGCISLEQKRTVVRQLRQLGLTPAFIDAVEDFVAGDNIDRHFPTPEEQAEMVRQYALSTQREIH
jgi:hypothetical protein